MKIGKLTIDELKVYVLDIIKRRRREVLTSSGISEDCAVIDVGKLLVTTDPITASGKNVGSLAVHVCANDVAACGGEPVACLLTIIAPTTDGLDDIKQVMLQAEQAAARLNVEIVGGHTEFSDAVNRIIVNCAMIGLAPKNIVSTIGAKVDDDIILTNYAATEATAIFANDYQNQLTGVLTADELAEAKQMIERLSVVKEGMLCAELGVSAMHDITEGGVFGAVYEQSVANKSGADIYVDKIPVRAITQKICRYYGFNPFKLISSGCMLITAGDGKKICKELEMHGIQASIIGKVTKNQVRAISKDGSVQLIDNNVDELCQAIKVLGGKQ